MNVKNVDEIEPRKSHGGALSRDLLPLDIYKSFSSIWYVIVPPRLVMPPHSHGNEEQIYFILEGEGVVSVGEEKHKVRAGDAIYLPPKVPHGFHNSGKKPCIYIGIGAWLKE